MERKERVLSHGTLMLEWRDGRREVNHDEELALERPARRIQGASWRRTSLESER